MNIVKRIFQELYCENCKFKDFYYKNEALKIEQRSLERKQIEIENIQNNFLKNVKTILPKDETILFITVDISSPLVLITLKTKYDFQGKIQDFTFRGYTNDYLEKTTSNFRREEMFVLAKYKQVSENFTEEYLHHFFIEDFPCTPNKGYGSMIMDTALNYLKQFAYHNEKIYISGWLSPVDKETHNERLHHFYSKFGFEFIFNDKGEEFIRKYL